MKTTMCRHYNGLFGPGMKPDHIPCAVGLNPRDMAGHNGRMIALPCLSDPCAAKPCPKFNAYTQAEVDADNKEFEDHAGFVVRARNLIVAKIEKTRAKAGSTVCPKCKGKLRYQQSPNGHIRARCETDGCLAWIE